MKATAKPAVGGWIKDHDGAAGRRYRELSEIQPASLDADRLAYFSDYRDRHFNESFLRGQGAEEIHRALAEHGGKPRRWADIGAGTTTAFWAIGLDEVREIHACDLIAEALVVLRDMVAVRHSTPCYRTALSLAGRDASHMAGVYDADWHYHVFDALAPWPAPIGAARFDLITAIGCFGLAKNPEQYVRAFAAAARQLQGGGRMIGADWVRSANFVAEEGHDNRYVSAGLIIDAARGAGLRQVALQTVAIVGDPYYDAVTNWAFTADRSGGDPVAGAAGSR
jgi:hypothetical protein